MKLKKFEKAYNELIDKFIKKYYSYDDGSMNYCEMWYLTDDRGFMHPIGIWDDYWSISDIYQALYLDIPEEIVHKWCDFALETYGSTEYLNLYTYFKKWNYKTKQQMS